MKALSIRQPWLDAILYGGKRIENRAAWKGSSFRGRLLLHAAKGMTDDEYGGVMAFLTARGIEWRPDHSKLARGALVGAASVIDVIMPGGLTYARRFEDRKPHPLRDDPWYMGEFALVLDHVKVFDTPIAYKGALGFFECSGVGAPTELV